LCRVEQGRQRIVQKRKPIFLYGKYNSTARKPRTPPRSRPYSWRCSRCCGSGRQSCWGCCFLAVYHARRRGAGTWTFVLIMPARTISGRQTAERFQFRFRRGLGRRLQRGLLAQRRVVYAEMCARHRCVAEGNVPRFLERTWHAARGGEGESGGKGCSWAGWGGHFRPEGIQRSTPRPDDFDDFWAAKIKELNAWPINPVLEPGPVSEAARWIISKSRWMASAAQRFMVRLVRPKREAEIPCAAHRAVGRGLCAGHMVGNPARGRRVSRVEHLRPRPAD